MREVVFEKKIKLLWKKMHKSEKEREREREILSIHYKYTW